MATFSAKCDCTNFCNVIYSIHHWWGCERVTYREKKVRFLALLLSLFTYPKINVGLKSNCSRSTFTAREVERDEMRDERDIRFLKVVRSCNAARDAKNATCRRARRATTANANDPWAIILTIVKDKPNNSHGEQTIYNACGPRLTAQRAAISRRLAISCIYITIGTAYKKKTCAHYE